MKDKTIYIFLDWSMTINELVKNGKISKGNFKNFASAIDKLEKRNSAKVKLMIVSGTNEIQAKTRFNILSNAFCEIGREDILVGFAYEYGAFMLDKSNRIHKNFNHPLTKAQWQRLKLATEKFGYEMNKLYQSYFNIEFEKFDERAYRFLDYCKNNITELDFEVYDDKYGHGIDIKNFLLNKGRFIELFLKKHVKEQPYMVIVGGDSPQDIKMFPQSLNCEKYFIGFYNEKYENLSNSILSKKSNIAGIVDCLEKISKRKVTCYAYDNAIAKQ